MRHFVFVDKNQVPHTDYPYKRKNIKAPICGLKKRKKEKKGNKENISRQKKLIILNIKSLHIIYVL